MSNEKPNPREARLQQALRENLKRRKQQQRYRQENLPNNEDGTDGCTKN
ncbi:MAG: hypothetical protein ACON5C_10250 [Alphaproteobacteria bacterium]